MACDPVLLLGPLDDVLALPGLHTFVDQLVALPDAFLGDTVDDRRSDIVVDIKRLKLLIGEPCAGGLVVLEVAVISRADASRLVLPVVESLLLRIDNLRDVAYDVFGVVKLGHGSLCGEHLLHVGKNLLHIRDAPRSKVQKKLSR